MCSECHQTPCDSRCPNYEPQVFGECDMCGAEIYEGEDYYEIAGGIYCEYCVSECKKEAECEEYADYDEHEGY